MSKRSQQGGHRGYKDRIIKTRQLRERFLIVCEGEKTEPNYFRNFRVSKEIVDIHGFGYNTIRLVKEALKLKASGDYTQVWCVFDRDSFPAKDFNSALELAKQKGICIAYSNEAFEIWYLLHFHYYNTGIRRSDYIKKLSESMGYQYRKNSITVYDELLPKQATAIENATRLLQSYPIQNPEQNNPSTTVHLLVKALNQCSLI